MSQAATTVDDKSAQRKPQADNRGRSRNVRQGDKGARTREQIKDALVELISRKSAQDIVLDDICSETNLTVGAFYFHFKNKDAALEEVSIDALHRFYDQLLGLPSSGNMIGDIGLLCETLVDLCARQPMLVRLMAEGLQIRGAAREAWVAENSRLTDEYAERLRAHRGGGSKLAVQVDVQFMAYGLETFMEHAALHREPGYTMLKESPEKLATMLTDLAVRTLKL